MVGKRGANSSTNVAKSFKMSATNLRIIKNKNKNIIREKEKFNYH